jgi:hypothetical protein
VSWSRYEGKAPAEITLTGAARDAELEDYIRLQNPHLTDVRLERATATGDEDSNRHWYRVTSLSDDGECHSAEK